MAKKRKKNRTKPAKNLDANSGTKPSRGGVREGAGRKEDYLARLSNGAQAWAAAILAAIDSVPDKPGGRGEPNWQTLTIEQRWWKRMTSQKESLRAAMDARKLLVM
ncbi:MAG: hypothetical protein ACREF8_02380, partial [Chthoniobacterales bacterium]